MLADPTLCDDENPCTQDWCEPDQGCMSEQLPDGFECGKCKMCSGSVCVDIEGCKDETCGCGTNPASSSVAWIFMAIFLLVLGRKR